VVGDSQREVTVVLFDGFELLDVFGPLEVFGVVPAWFSIRLAGPDAAPVRSGPGPAVVADVSYRDAGTPDIVPLCVNLS
jgi:transcriptional regulator GlxA family with amidase domain